jgi:hypothetical protein
MLVDTSAWVELLRKTGSPEHLALAKALQDDVDVAVTGIIVLEVLQGCRDDGHAREVGSLLRACRGLDPVYPDTYTHAASLYRRCRAASFTVRSPADCLIAALALEWDVPILTKDARDFAPLAATCGVRLLGAQPAGA